MRNRTLKASDIKSAISPMDFYHKALGLTLNRSSRPWVEGGLCPFHDDANVGSFRVNVETGAFRCFSCGENGSDVIDFTKKTTGKPFVDCLHFLNQEWRR